MTWRPALAATAALTSILLGGIGASLPATSQAQSTAPETALPDGLSAADWREVDPGSTVVFDTTKGRVIVELAPWMAPGHARRITELTREGFYNGLAFHRVIDGFMAQTGCPQGRGTGGSKYPDIKAEFNAEPHVRGTASMARAQNPNSANSQFFICFDDARFLDRQYTVWGKVVDGMDNVDAINKGEPPRSPDKMVSVKIAADAMDTYGDVIKAL